MKYQSQLFTSISGEQWQSIKAAALGRCGVIMTGASGEVEWKGASFAYRFDSVEQQVRIQLLRLPAFLGIPLMSEQKFKQHISDWIKTSFGGRANPSPH